MSLKYSLQSIITYSDISKFKVRFKPIQPNPITEPNYVWVTNNNNIVSRYKTQKHKLLEQGLGTEEQTEDEIMTRLGYMKIYDNKIRMERVVCQKQREVTYQKSIKSCGMI